MNRGRSALAAVSVMVAAMILAACGGSDSTDPTARHTALSGGVFSNADVEFATEVVQHHAQSLALVDLLDGREVSPELMETATRIRDRQGIEIEQATDWLTVWDQPIPATLRDHASAHGALDPSVNVGQKLPGAISTDQIHALEARRGDEFERRWLELMIKHHHGAATITGDEGKAGAFKASVALANAIETASKAELDDLEALLD